MCWVSREQGSSQKENEKCVSLPFLIWVFQSSPHSREVRDAAPFLQLRRQSLRENNNLPKPHSKWLGF